MIIFQTQFVCIKCSGLQGHNVIVRNEKWANQLKLSSSKLEFSDWEQSDSTLVSTEHLNLLLEIMSPSQTLDRM